MQKWTTTTFSSSDPSNEKSKWTHRSIENYREYFTL